MKRTTVVLLMALCASLALGPAALAQAPGGQAGESNVANLSFEAACEMHPDAGGQIAYTLSGPRLDFVFNGRDLPAGELRLYANGVLLGAAAANGGGNVLMQGSVAGSGALSGAFELRHSMIHEGQPHECVLLRSGPNGYVYQP